MTALQAAIVSTVLCAAESGFNPSTTIVEFLSDKGIQSEDHFIQTEDDYVLHAFRLVPNGLQVNPSVLILQHGFLASAWCWLVSDLYTTDGGAMAPGLALHALGYDVWLTNSRGNSFSRNHSTLDVNSQEFWSFTFTDMGRYDVVANVRRAMAVTGATHVSFLGWSQG